MKRILVTGANKGIGLAIVTKLLQDFPDTYLLLGSRDVGRGQAALQQVVEQLGDAGKERVELIQIDVTSDESVKNAVEAIKAKHGDSEPLFGLVNNAGGMSESPRGIVDLNTYGLRRVCEAFLPLIQKEKGSLDLLFNSFYIVGIFQVALSKFLPALLPCLLLNAARRFKLS